MSAGKSGKAVKTNSQHAVRHVYRSHSPEETIALGRTLAERLPPPKLIVLRGDLGAGKTTLVKGIAAALGAAEPEEVSSPTFTLVHEYAGSGITQANATGNPGGAVLLYHIDLYRIETERQLETIGIEDLETPQSLLLIEWGEKFSSLAARSDGEIAIEILPGEERRITLILRPRKRG